MRSLVRVDHVIGSGTWCTLSGYMEPVLVARVNRCIVAYDIGGILLLNLITHWLLRHLSEIPIGGGGQALTFSWCVLWHGLALCVSWGTDLLFVCPGALTCSLCVLGH